MSDKITGNSGLFSLADYETRRSGRSRKQVQRFEVEQAESLLKPNENDDDADADYDEANEDEESEDSEWGASGRRSKRPARRQSRRRTSARMKASESEEESGEDSDSEEYVADRTALGLRTKARKSYAEVSSDDDYDEADKQVDRYRRQQAEAAVDDTSAIDMVLDRRVADTGDDSDEGSDSDSDDDGYEYLIKWNTLSNIHNSWKKISELKGRRGFKRLTNFIQRRVEEDSFMEECTQEEKEQLMIDRELTKQTQEDWCKVERVVDMREADPGSDDGSDADDDKGLVTQYFCKWLGLPYADCTWENAEDIVPFQSKVDAFHQRQQNLSKPATTWGKNKQRLFKELQKQPDWLTAGELRDYQVAGLNWLIFSWCKDNNCILADEMGLGKTIQCISFIAYLQIERQIPGPFLIVAPLSTINAWSREFAKWAPWLNAVVYVGNQKSREIIREHEFYRVPNTARAKKPKLAVEALMTTYEIVLKDAAYLRSLNYKLLAVDEAHRLKDHNSQLYQALSDFKSANRLLITGTPLQNTVRELWSLLHFLHPDRFDSLEDFEEKYSQNTLTQGSHIASLHDVLQPHLLRRVKKDVLKSLPAKTERILRVQMTPMQKRYQQLIVARNFRELNKGVKGKKSSLINIVMELKKCCNHPYLFETAYQEDRETYKAMYEKKAKEDGRHYDEETAMKQYNDLYGLIHNAGKMKLLDKLLERLKATGHRVLIFSQMVRMLDILERYLRLKGFFFQRLDGGMDARSRTTAMDSFNAKDSRDFCFILSTRAGGLGINLATADTVIIFDSDWNPQNDLQAEARAHRIGQKHAVNIYRLVTHNSVEESILERAKQKMVLDHLIIQRMDTSGRMVSGMARKKKVAFDQKELSKILRFGAEDLFKEKDTDAQEGGKQSDEMDIDEILQRAETHTSETTGETDAFLSAFKVANFTSDTAEDEKADDAFWQRVVPTEMIPEDQLRDENAVQLWLPPRKRNVVHYAEDKLASRGSSSTPKSRFGRKAAGQLYRAILQYGSLPRAIDELVATTWKSKSEKFQKTAEGVGRRMIREALGKVKAWESAQEKTSKKTKSKSKDKKKKKSKSKKDHAAEEDAAKEEALTVDVEDYSFAADDFITKLSEMDALTLKVNETLDRTRKASKSGKKKTNNAKQKDADNEDGKEAVTKRDLSSFRLNITCPPVKWKVNGNWGVREDSMLLLGVYMHGRGSWDTIVNEPALKLHGVLHRRRTPVKAENVMKQEGQASLSQAASAGGAPPASSQTKTEEASIKVKEEAAEPKADAPDALKSTTQPVEPATDAPIAPDVASSSPTTTQSPKAEQTGTSELKPGDTPPAAAADTTTKTEGSDEAKATTPTPASKLRPEPTKDLVRLVKNSQLASRVNQLLRRLHAAHKELQRKAAKRAQAKAKAKSKAKTREAKTGQTSKKRKASESGKSAAAQTKKKKAAQAKVKSDPKSPKPKAGSAGSSRKRAREDEPEGSTPKKTKADAASGKASVKRKSSVKDSETFDPDLLKDCKGLFKRIKATGSLTSIQQLSKSKNGLSGNKKLASQLLTQIGDSVQDILDLPDVKKHLTTKADKAFFENHVWHFASLFISGMSGSRVKHTYLALIRKQRR